MKIGMMIMILVVAILMVEGKEEEKYRIVQSSPAIMVKEGSETMLGCKSSQPWFFCLWRPPVGEKECSLQEGGGVRKVCRQGREELEVGGGDSSCSLNIPKVTLADHGDFLCLLNQAETFLTARAIVKVEVATEAGIKVRMGGSEVEKVEAVDGEMVELECEAKRAHPAPTLTWVVPDGVLEDAVVEELEKDEGHTSKLVSKLTYRASASHSSSKIQCISSQVDPASKALLFSSESNITLAISQSAPLLSSPLSLSGKVGLITAILLAIAIVLLTLLLVLVLVVKKKKKRVSSSTPLPSPTSSKVWRVNSIWTSEESRNVKNFHLPHTTDLDEDLHCRVEVHNSSASSTSTSSTSTANTSYEANQIASGNFVSYSSMYHQEKIEVTPRGPVDLVADRVGTSATPLATPTSSNQRRERPHSLFSCPHECFSPHSSSPKCPGHESDPNLPTKSSPPSPSTPQLLSPILPPPAHLYSSYVSHL